MCYLNVIPKMRNSPWDQIEMNCVEKKGETNIFEMFHFLYKRKQCGDVLSLVQINDSSVFLKKKKLIILAMVLVSDNRSMLANINKSFLKSLRQFM